MSSLCNVEACTFPAYKDNDECVLHCQKHDYQTDKRSGLLEHFSTVLIEYLSLSITKQNKLHPASATPAELEKYFAWSDGEDKFISRSGEAPLAAYFNSHTVVFEQIIFPTYSPKDHFNYGRILKQINLIHFWICEFNVGFLPLHDTHVYFDECTFHENWQICHTDVLRTMTETAYDRCVFTKEVTRCYQTGEGTRQLEGALFSDCQFDDRLQLKNVTLVAPLFKNQNPEIFCIPQFELDNCEVRENLNLSGVEAAFVRLKDCKFLSKVEMKGAEIGYFHLENSNFNKLFDAHGAKFQHFKARRVIFYDFAGFEHCQFSSDVSLENASTAIFQFTTFMDFASFRSAVFHQGLDIDTTNLKASPNFLNICIYSNNTTQETYRIIKDSFDKIGNHIEANKYFVKEMQKYKQSLRGQKWNQARLVFELNSLISDFGQSYCRPIAVFISLGLILSLIRWGKNKDLLYTIVDRNGPISSFIDGVNFFAASILPFKSLVIKDMEFISMLFYIMFTILIWQIVVAIKRHTRR